MKYDNIYVYIIIIVLIYFIFFYNFKESLNNKDDNNNDTKRITRKYKCEGCYEWNNRDIKSKCDAICMKENPEKYIRSTKNLIKGDNYVDCNCKYIGTLQKNYVGCPLKEVGSYEKDCFIWNDNEAKNRCQSICDKYLHNKKAEWTGKWKNTSAETSACECAYYD